MSTRTCPECGDECVGCDDSSCGSRPCANCRRLIVTVVPAPDSSWTRDGWMSHDAPTERVIQRSADSGQHARLAGFVFRGPGWYPSHRVLVTATGDEKGGDPTYELRFYRTDPRPAFAAIASLAEVTS